MVAVFTLVTSEFLPASLLPLMAADLGVTEGVAGQVVTATALVGMVAGPSMGLLFPRLDRRRLIIGLLALAVVSNLLSAVAPTYLVVIVSRLLLGVALAGTWSMALAVASQLVPAAKLGRAMAVVNLGVSAATVAAVPLGALISSYVRLARRLLGRGHRHRRRGRPRSSWRCRRCPPPPATASAPCSRCSAVA